MGFLVVAVLLLTALYLINNYLLTRWSRRGFLQLEPMFLVGDIGEMFKLKKTMGEYFQQLYNKYKNHKTVGLYFSYRQALLVNDPLLVQDILIRDFTSFHDRPFHIDEEVSRINCEKTGKFLLNHFSSSIRLRHICSVFRDKSGETCG